MATRRGTKKSATKRTTRRYDLFSMEFAFLTRAQVTRMLGLPRHTIDRLIATGQLTQYRTVGLGRGGQRVFYSRSQVERVRGLYGGRRR